MGIWNATYKPEKSTINKGDSIEYSFDLIIDSKPRITYNEIGVYKVQAEYNGIKSNIIEFKITS